MSRQDFQQYARDLEARIAKLEGENEAMRNAQTLSEDAITGERQEPYRSLYELNHDAVFMVDREGRFLDANPAATRQSGYSVDELRQMTFMDLCAPDRLEDSLAAFQESMLGRPRDIDTAMIRRDGKRVELLVSGAPIVRGGEVTGAFGIAKDITQRKESEEALRQSDERLRLAAEAAGFGTYLHVFETDHTEWSTELKRIFGLPTDTQPKLEEAMQLVHPEDRERVQQKIDATAQAPGVSSFEDEHRILLPDGSLRWVHAKGHSQPAKAGKPARFFGAVLDITDRKRAEEKYRRLNATLEQQVAERTEALLESKERIRAIVDTAVEGIITIDDQGLIETVNPEALSIFGYAPDELIGRNVNELMPSPYHEAHDGYLSNYLRTGEKKIIGIGREVEGLRKNGEMFPLELAVTELRVGGQRKFAGFLRDITRRKKTEQALRESEQRFRRIYTHAATGIAITDRDGTFVQCNPAYSRIVGYSEKELAKIRFSSLVHPDDRAENLRQIQPLLEGEIPYFEIVNRYMRKTGETVWVHTFVSLVHDDQGRGTHIMALVTDISERQRAEEAVRRSEQALSAFFTDAPVGLLWISRDARVLRVNRAQLDMLGFDDEEEMMGHRILDFDVSDDFESELLGPLGQGRPVQSHRSRWTRKDGTVVHVLIDASPVQEGETLVRSDWFVRDITRRVELERQLLEVVERERQQLGAELHDHLGQILHGVHFLASELQARLHQKGAEEADELRCISRHLEEALSTTRNVAKGLQPVPPVPEGLTVALREHAALVSKLYNVDCRFICPRPVEVADKTVATHIFRIAQEAVTNALKHADCKHINIELKSTPEQLVIGIQDDGHGCLPAPSQRNGMGLRVMQFRAAAIKASLVLQNKPGSGTDVVCSITPSREKQPEP